MYDKYMVENKVSYQNIKALAQSHPIAFGLKHLAKHTGISKKEEAVPTAVEITETEEQEADTKYEKEFMDLTPKHHAYVEPLYIELILQSKMNMATQDTFYMMDHIYD